jgi:hypothetical protein
MRSTQKYQSSFKIIIFLHKSSFLQVEIGNYDSFYEMGMEFSSEKVLTNLPYSELLSLLNVHRLLQHDPKVGY